MDALMQEEWRKAAGKMASKLRADARNGVMLASPWPRAVHSMVVGWQIRLSQPPTSPRPRRWRPTWEVFAVLAVENAITALKHVNRPAWHKWAASRVTPTRRYIPKRNRPPALRSQPQGFSSS
ncbi:MAG: hypothetical protein IPK69_02340 [Phycisphaerales bacterium]|jgi:hypothetical protein|nr:MAG: hypothetical protein IPK69_02340 [Phycisphaerales bacterium]